MKRFVLILAVVALLFALAGSVSLASRPSLSPGLDALPGAGTAEPGAVEETAEVEGQPGIDLSVLVSRGDYTQLNPAEIPAPDLVGETTEVFRGGDSANMRLTLPEGWDYEPVSETREATEDRDAYENFGIRFWPTEGVGSMTLWYYPMGFGVCGNGLTEQKVTFPNGLTAYRGSYRGPACWEFVAFQDTPGRGSYVAMNGGLDSDGLDTAMEILGTAVLGEGISE